MHSRSSLARVGAAVLGASAALTLSALPASADEVKARVAQGHHFHEHGFLVDLGEKHKEVSTTLFRLNLDSGNSLQAYCVEINVKLDAKRGMTETPWDQFPNDEAPFDANRDKIKWVLQNGYPTADSDALEQQLTEDGVRFDDGLSEPEAITATQAAVWHFSDAKDINRKHPLPKNPDSADDVLAVYDYLTGKANVGSGESPKPTLDVSPDGAAGNTGDRLGPFTVSTTGEITDIKTDLPDGVTITDAEGKELTPADITDGTKIFVNVPEDAAESDGAFQLKGTGHVDLGRLFVADGYDDKPAQSLIVAQSEDTKLSAGASVSWKTAPETTRPPEETPTSTEAPAPTTPSSEAAVVPTPAETDVTPQAESGDLAETGFSIMTPIIVGAVLLGAGIAALLFQRRRKNA